MSIRMCGVFLLCLLGGGPAGYSQTRKIDSLKKALLTAKEDTGKVIMLNELALSIRNNYLDSSIVIDSQALALATKLKFEFRIAKTRNDLGTLYRLKSDYPKSLEHYLKAIDCWTKMELDPSLKVRAKKGLSATLGNIGIVYKDQANYPEALRYYFEALKIAEEIDDRPGIARHLGNIGNVYDKQGNHDKALDFFSQALKISEQIGNKNEMALWQGSIGNVYTEKGDFPRALEYNLKVLKTFEELGNKNSIGAVLGNIGVIYGTQAETFHASAGRDSLLYLALDYYLRSLKVQLELGNIDGAAIQYSNIGTLYSKLKRYHEAEIYLKRAIVLDDSVGSMDGTRDAEKAYSDLDSMQGDYKGAMEHYKKYIAARDSISNDENTKKQTQTEMQYGFDKKVAEAKALQDKKDAVTRIVIYSISGGLLLVLVLAFFIFRSYRQKQKANIIITLQKEEVEKQKKMVEGKQKEILDSIHYARRIQRSLLPTEKYISKKLAERDV